LKGNIIKRQKHFLFFKIASYLNIGVAIRVWPVGPTRRPAEKTRGEPG